MNLIKINTVNYGSTYVNIDSISSFNSYVGSNGFVTSIRTLDEKTFEVKGDIASKLAKIISSSTKGNISTLE